MERDKLIETWQAEEARPFLGWDFSYLDGRMFEDETPWSYERRAAELLRSASVVLDMDTGGGERLLGLKEHWPGKVVATENYPPNFQLATERLAPYGVQVVDVALSESDAMPFASGEFDLVLNRHGSFNPQEVARVLARGGIFLTQQVHGLWGHDLQAAFDTRPQWPDATPERYIPMLTAAGLTIVHSQDWSGRLVFRDVGAIVYYLKAIPWTVPGFSVATHLRHLLRLQERVERGEGLNFTARKYLIEAQNAS